jgi:hypothetical protein
VADYLDIQGYRKGRLNRDPDYILKYDAYRIAYRINKSYIEREEFRLAYFRALKMVKGVKPEPMRDSMRHKTQARREAGKLRGYKRRLRKAERIADVPVVSQGDMPPA